MPDTHDPRLAIAGFLIGILVGMTGMGGGSLMTPMLILFFKFDPAIAVGTDILHGAIFKSVGAARHRRLGTVRLRLGLWMLVGSAPMSLVGGWAGSPFSQRRSCPPRGRRRSSATFRTETVSSRFPSAPSAASSSG